MKGRNEVEDGYEDGNGDEDAGGQQGGEKEGEGERKRGSGEERGEYFIVVVEDEKGMVVGTGGLVVERKLSVFSSSSPRGSTLLSLEGCRAMETLTSGV